MLIFDEATSALDADTSEQFARTVNQIKGGTTILFITHQAPRSLAFDAVIQLGEKAAAAGEATGAVVRPLIKPRAMNADEQVPAVH